MPDPWLPGAYVDKGRNAGYNAGRSQMLRTVAHYTVGYDSRNTGRDGYCHFIVHRDQSRENGCTQYAEIDAVTWHAANQGNLYGPGIEWERMTTGGQNDEGLSNAEELTQNQIEWGNRIVAFCMEWGIEARLYDGPRFGADVMPGGNYRGWVNHHDIDDQRTDGLLRAEWDAICGGEPEPEPEQPVEEDDVLVCVNTDKDAGHEWEGLWIFSDSWLFHGYSVNALSPGRTLFVGTDEIKFLRQSVNDVREAIGAKPL